MRTFEQRLEEIRRRGMALRRKRKARQLTCTALCTLVCFGAGLWMIFSATVPTAPPRPQLQDTTPPTVKQEDTAPSAAIPVRQLEIWDSEGQRLCSDDAQLLEIYELLDTITAEGSVMHSEESFSGTASDFQDDYMADSVPETQLFLTMADGSTQAYTLVENVLTEQSSGSRYLLDTGELLRLNQLIRKDEAS